MKLIKILTLTILITSCISVMITTDHIHELEEGMNYREVVEVLDRKPDNINRSEGKYGTHTQFVYRNFVQTGMLYVYFRDGELTSIQY